MRKVAARLRKSGKFSRVICAYLEITRPSIEEAIAECVRQKAVDIRVLPYFLLTGRHVRSHIPSIVAQAKKKYRGASRIMLCPYLGYDAKIAALAEKRVFQGK